MKNLTIGEIQDLQLKLMKKLHIFLKAKEIKYYLICGSALGAIRHNGFIPWDSDIDVGMFREDYERFLCECDTFDKNYEIINFQRADNCDFCLTRIYFPGTLLDIESIRETKLDKRLYMDIFPLDNVPACIQERNVFEKKIKRFIRISQFIDARNYNNSFTIYSFKRLLSICLKPFRSVILTKIDHMLKTYDRLPTEYVCSICSQYSFRKQAMPKTYYGNPTLHKFEDSEFFIPEQTELYLSQLYGDDYMQIPPESKRRPIPHVYLL